MIKRLKELSKRINKRADIQTHDLRAWIAGATETLENNQRRISTLEKTLAETVIVLQETHRLAERADFLQRPIGG